MKRMYLLEQAQKEELTGAVTSGRTPQDIATLVMKQAIERDNLISNLAEEDRKDTVDLEHYKASLIKNRFDMESKLLRLKQAEEIRAAEKAGRDVSDITARHNLEIEKQREDQAKAKIKAESEREDLLEEKARLEEGGRKGGSFGGVAEMFRRIQSGIFGDDVQKKQLKKLESIDKRLEELNEETGVGGVGV